ncbi:hypothetical protein AVEN_10880-1 [Araneus ventricosus]|uniref:Uncharacterized protein n=1 Tax=Araneus ventricosus TaxID=182803 RepID=A0A4Y2QZA7_ARAVE|nr:hypothetical protein AVEN_10880-1 [Araneus ventricosus]
MTRTAPELASPFFRRCEPDKRKGALYASMIYRAIGSVLDKVLMESGFEPGTLLSRRQGLSNRHHGNSCNYKLHGIHRSLSSKLAFRLLQ